MMSLSLLGTVNLMTKYIPQRLRRFLKKIESRFGRDPDFVILSTGRAGSTYTAKLLEKMGINCAHEKFFSPDGYFRSWRYRADSSWLALPYLEKCPEVTKRIVHQVRDPLDVVSSLYGIGFFNPDFNNAFSRFVRGHFNVTGDELLDCVRFWTEWNSRCEVISCYTYKFEDLLSSPEEILCEIVGKGVNESSRNIIKGLPKEKVNARKRKEVRIEDIPECKEKNDMKILARKYGYDY